MTNKRVFYAVREVGFAQLGSQNYTPVKGASNMGMSTNFALQPIFELGQLSLLDNLEEIPEVTMTMEKIFDGQAPITLLATRGTTGPTLIERSNVRTSIAASTFSDLQSSASGTPVSSVELSGAYLNSVNLAFNTEGAFTESVDFVSNNRVWNTSPPFVFSGVFNNTETPSGIGILRRQNFLFNYVGGSPVLDVNGSASNTASGTVLPQDIPGISSSGTNNLDATGNFGAHIQSVSVQTSLNRTNILELGRRGVFFKYTTYPIEITCDISVLSTAGDQVSATEVGVVSNGRNLHNRSIKIFLEQGDVIDLGTKCKLQSVSSEGGNTDGSNEILNFSYQTFNDFTWTSPLVP